MKQAHPSLVVLDRLIDQKDCLYYIEEIRAQGYAGPVLVVSVVDDPKAALDAGATAFLVKPVPPFSLLNIIRELVQGEASKTILLVDDDEVSRYVIGGALARSGYRILEARSGREALRMVQKEIPDAVILDIAMPEMNGFEVLHEIRVNAVSKALPVIIHSSRALSQQEQKLLFSDKRTIVYSKRTFEEEGGPGGLLRTLQSMGLGV
jgi:CheY-like chemotaxis protein